MPLISVILPVYNSEKYIAEAVQSILDQSFRDFELLIINDASTDRTSEILAGFTDSRIKIINNSVNLKVVKSLNKGLQLAEGEFIARMDADDIAYPQRFEKQVAFLRARPDIHICGTWVQAFEERNFAFTSYGNPEDFKAALLFHNVIIHPSVMFRKDKFVENNLKYDELFVNAEDYGLWVEAVEKLKITNLPLILLKYRIHNSNASVVNEKNLEVIRQMNCAAYKRFLLKVGIQPTELELVLHFRLGFKIIKSVAHEQLKDYLNWLEKIVVANKQSGYINRNSLLNEIVKLIVFLAKRAPRSVNSFYTVLKVFFKIFELKDILHFIPYKIIKKYSYNKRLAAPGNSAIFGEIKEKAQFKVDDYSPENFEILFR